jgi:hypothetical protein
VTDLSATTPREDVRAAFVTILTDANLGVSIYKELPFEGADQRSIVLTMVSGTSRSPGVGMYGGPAANPTGRAVMNLYHLQVDINYDDKAGCSQLADQVEQAIWEAHEELRDTYDIHGLQKVLDIDTLPLGASLRMPVLTREARVIMDWTFWTHRQLAT